MSSDDGRDRASPVGRRILVAEDNLVNRRVATALLELSGHDVRCVANGREALDAVMNGGFDLVLMDLEMPELDGIATTRLIRAREKGAKARLPIVALTARRSAGDRARCLEAGMDDYLTKPLDPAALGAAIARLTDDGAAPRRRRRARPRRR